MLKTMVTDFFKEIIHFLVIVLLVMI